MRNKVDRWLCGIGGAIFFYLGVKEGAAGDYPDAFFSCFISLLMFLGLLWFAIDARIAQVEKRLSLRDTLEQKNEWKAAHGVFAGLVILAWLVAPEFYYEDADSMTWTEQMVALFTVVPDFITDDTEYYDKATAALAEYGDKVYKTE